MTDQELLQDLADMVIKNHNGMITFDFPVVIKTSPHDYPIRIIQVEAYNETVPKVYLQDADKNLIALEPSHKKFALIAYSIRQRLKNIEHHKIKSL
jgi:hypothetical protein